MTARKPIVIDPADSAQCAELPAGDWVDQLPIFGAGGLLTGVRVWAGSQNTTGSTFSIDISSAGFSSILAVSAVAERLSVSSPTAIDRAFVTLWNQNVSTTAIGGFLTVGTNLGGLGGNTLVNNGSTYKVHLLVIGT